MNPFFSGFAAQAVLILVGLSLSAWTGARLGDEEQLDHPGNPFGINRSPYGEVFAMAMQGPINTDFHVGMYGATPEEMWQRSLENKKPEAEPGSLLMVEPEPEENCNAGCCPDMPGPCNKDESLPPSLLGKMEHLIEQMRIGHARRTNPLPASETLKFHIRRSAEDKLRLAYNLDPAHYANYNSLHFFLTEGISTRPELVNSVDELARQTIQYCLTREDDPRPALTAAAAGINLLQLMFKQTLDGENPHSIESMKAELAQVDQCIRTYQKIAAQWSRNGNWRRLSRQRLEECQTRIQFIHNMRNACEKTIERIHNQTELSS